jgi:hypothetical protein
MTHLGVAALLCALLAACGGNGTVITEVGPIGASPDPPAAAPGHAGFLHVLASRQLTTYRIDDETGQLAMTADQPMGDVHQLSGETEGRFVYMAYGPRTAQHPYGEPRPSIVAYAPSPQDGSLTAASEAWSYPIWQSGMPVSCGWTSLSAGGGRVYAMWYTGTYHDTYWDYVTHTVARDGQLGQAYDYLFDEFAGGEGMVDARSAVLYKRGATGLTAHTIGADGHLTQMGWSGLCVGSELWSVRPLVAARGFLFAAAHTSAREDTVCSYEGARLATRANLGFWALTADAFVPDADSIPAQLAIPTTIAASEGRPARHELRLYAIRSDGDLQLQDTVETAAAVGQVLFHPEGRFLFAGVGTALWAYSIGPAGHLTKVEDLPAAAGRMAVTFTSSRNGAER